MQPSKLISENNETLKYMKQLDGLRAIAILTVLYTHYSPQQYHLFGIDWGAYAVRLFFVLSGFLITGILLKCREKIDPSTNRLFVLRQFYIRRFIRIFPIFYITLAVGLLIGIPFLKETIFWHVTYLSNIYFTLQNNWFGYLGAFWSLAVEEQFYLVWPWLIILLPKRMILPAIMTLIFMDPISRLIGILFNLNIVFIYGSTPVVLDTLGFGSLLAYLHYYRDKNANSSTVTIVKVCFLVGLPLLVFILVLNRVRYDQILDVVFRDTALGLIFIWVVFRAARGFGGTTGKFLESPIITYLGKISYGMYVVHMFVVYEINNCFQAILSKEIYNQPFTWIFIALISVLATTLVAMISWQYLEKPINDLKRFFPYIPK